MVDVCSNIPEEHATCIVRVSVFLIQIDAEVVGKIGMCWLYGKVGEYLANQSNWAG